LQVAAGDDVRLQFDEPVTSALLTSTTNHDPLMTDPSGGVHPNWAWFENATAEPDPSGDLSVLLFRIPDTAFVSDGNETLAVTGRMAGGADHRLRLPRRHASGSCHAARCRFAGASVV
jgi:hypothetical protein